VREAFSWIRAFGDKKQNKCQTNFFYRIRFLRGSYSQKFIFHYARIFSPKTCILILRFTPPYFAHCKKIFARF